MGRLMARIQSRGRYTGYESHSKRQKPRPAPAPTPHSEPVPIEIDVIDTSDVAGWLEAATRVGEIEVDGKGVGFIVDEVIKKAGNRPIGRLNILDHSSEYGMEFGEDGVTESNIDNYRTQLKRLRGKFTKNGFVHLKGCDVGQNHALIVELAKILGVSVYAGTGTQNNVFRTQLGDYVRGDPNGTFHSKVTIPD
jgi:Domain of unknown function (DUF4347)